MASSNVTYLGYVYGTLSAFNGRCLATGVIVQVGSALAYRGIPLQAAYCGAKHAIQGFVDSLRCELLHDRSRLRVSMVQRCENVSLRRTREGRLAGSERSVHLQRSRTRGREGLS